MDAKLSNMNVNMGFILDDVRTLQLKMEQKEPWCNPSIPYLMPTIHLGSKMCEMFILP
jgi:hypothetical protein